MAYTYQHGDRPLDGYEIQRAVGRGGFGEVYYAISDGGREVALKYLRDNPEIELRGVTHCMNLKSPHLVSIFDVRQNTNGEYFIVMEYVSGPSLRDLLIAEPQGLGVQKAAYFVREIGKGLSYLHDRGIVHRDLKPGNIFYEDGYVKIGDYGLSKFISVSRHSAQTASVGTVHYMAPEVGSGNYSRGIDIYALGVILYEMLLGRVPFEGSTMGEVLMKHLTTQAAVDELPAPFADVIRKALAKDPADRYQTVDDMIQHIFGVDSIEQSVVGFNPTSLSSVARHQVGGERGSPIPSPNPVRVGPKQAAGRIGGAVRAGTPQRPRTQAGTYQLTDRLSRRAEKIRKRVDQRIEKLGGTPRQSQQQAAVARKHPKASFGDSALIFIAILGGLGLLSGWVAGEPEIGFGSAILGLATSLAALIGTRLSSDPRARPHAKWANRIILLAIGTPIVLLGSVPFQNMVRGDDAWGMFWAMIACLALMNWRERAQNGRRGDLNVGFAISAGILALIVAAIGEVRDERVVITGLIAAGTSLMFQAFGWFAMPWPKFIEGEKGTSTEQEGNHSENRTVGRIESVLESADAHLEKTVGAVGHALGEVGHYAGETVAWASEAAKRRRASSEPIPFGVPVSQRVRRPLTASNYPLPPYRSTFARAVWSILAFCLFGGMVATIIVNATTVHHPDEHAALGMASSICGAFLIFALGKVTLRKRPTVWREHVRPFLTAVALAGCVSFPLWLGLSIEANHPDSRMAFIIGTILSAGLLVVTLAVRGRQAPREYWQSLQEGPVLSGASPEVRNDPTTRCGMTNYECLDEAAKELGSPPTGLRIREILEKATELFPTMANTSEGSASATMDFQTINVRGRATHPGDFDAPDRWNRSPAFVKVARGAWRRLSEEERMRFATLWSNGEALLRHESFDAADWDELFRSGR